MSQEIKVEIGQFRIVDKGALKGFFSLAIWPTGQKIIDCRYFVQGENRWFSFPQKEVKKTDGSKPDYIPYISFINKEYAEALKAAVLLAIKNYKPTESNGAQGSSEKNKAYSVQGQTPVDVGLPF